MASYDKRNTEHHEIQPCLQETHPGCIVCVVIWICVSVLPQRKWPEMDDAVAIIGVEVMF